MGALSNSGRRTANYVGFYKGIQSAGMATMWAWDSTKPPFMTELAAAWAMPAISLVIAAPLVFLKIHDQADELVELKDVGEIDAGVTKVEDEEAQSTMQRNDRAVEVEKPMEKKRST